MICNNCGSELKLTSNDGGTKIYTCPCCGSVKEVEAPAPAIVSTPVSHVERSGEDVFEENIGSIVEIYCDLGNGNMSSGSGYVVSTNGKIVTNTHVVTNGSQPVSNIVVKIMGKQYPASVISLGDNKGGRGNGVDLALIRLNDIFVTTKPVTFSSSSVRNGMKVYAVGNSLGQGTCITTGIVSDKSRTLGDGKTYIMTDCAINPGNSGGPLFNGDGEVIGSVVSGITSAEGMNFAIPYETVQKFISMN